jgi:membrane protein
MQQPLAHFLSFITLLKDSFKELGKNDPLRMAGATAFFTTFALPPILIILLQVLGLFFEPQMIQGQLFRNLESVIGRESVPQLITVLQSFSAMAQNWLVTIAGFLFLVFVATTLFKIIQGSLNQVWKIKVVKKKNLLRNLEDRLQSLAVILVAGLLFVLGLVSEAAQSFLGKYLYDMVPEAVPYFNTGLNHLISVLIGAAWFSILFRFLPDARAPWKAVFPGALLTSVLFHGGKILIRWLLSLSNIKTIYGASGSVMLLLLFVFYSSLLLYYGAAFTKTRAVRKHIAIEPNHYAMHYKLEETNED